MYYCRDVPDQSVGKENLPVMQEIPVENLDWEDPLEKRYATHFSVLGLPVKFSWCFKEDDAVFQKKDKSYSRVLQFQVYATGTSLVVW